MNQSDIVEARKQIIEAAKWVLSGRTSAIEGARIIARCRFTARLEEDPDVLPFVGIASETEALPLGTDRIHGQARALTDLQPKIDEAEAWASDFAQSHCKNLLTREHAILRC